MHANVCPATSFGPNNMKSMWNSLIWWSSFFARTCGACIARPCTHFLHQFRNGKCVSLCSSISLFVGRVGTATFSGDLDPASTSSSTVISASSIADTRFGLTMCSCKPAEELLLVVPPAFPEPGTPMHASHPSGETQRTAVTCLRLHSAELHDLAAQFLDLGAVGGTHA